MNSTSIPERTCVSCKKKSTKDEFYKITKVEENYLFDENLKLQGRGTYVCKSSSCIEKLSKNKKYKISYEELFKMLNSYKKKNLNLKATLEVMKNSGSLVFGNEMLKEAMKRSKVYLVIIAEDLNSKINTKLVELCKTKKIKFIHGMTREELGGIFSKKDVNVIGILDKDMVSGILKKI